MRDTDPLDLGLVEVADAIRRKQVSSEEVTRAALARAEAMQPRLNAFAAIEAEAALTEAKAADALLAHGHLKGSLHGVPLAHKDMYYRAGMVSAHGTRIRRDFVPTTTATALARLDAAGALHLGRLNMSEFALNPTGHNAHWGDCCNPWNPARVTGGSSSGSGAAVAARIVYGALGSDTGGSIRLPAAFCGVSGIKPTYGRISRFGAMPLSFSMDHVGPLARTARDCARLLTALAGHDPNDPTSSRRPVPDYEDGIDLGVKGLRVGLPTGYFAEDLHPAVAAGIDAAAAALRECGASVEHVELPDMPTLNALGAVLARSEAAAIHRRWLATRPDDYTSMTRSFVEIGLALPATRYVEALGLRGPMLAEFKRAVFRRFDLLLVPTTPTPAPTRAETDASRPGGAAANNAIAAFTRPFNYLGLPSLALPCGFSGDDLPVSVQLVGAPYQEALVLRAGHAFQTATEWHAARPPGAG